MFFVQKAEKAGKRRKNKFDAKLSKNVFFKFAP